MSTVTKNIIKCTHCGEECEQAPIKIEDKNFCCQGCKTVYQLLNNTGLCDYYSLNENPGINQRVQVRKDKFAFLDDEAIRQKLISFCDEQQTHVSFYLPHIHCSSCLYLLENLHKLNENIISSQVNFGAKEVSIVFGPGTSLRKVAEILSAIGYEPYISLNALGGKKPRVSKRLIYQLGIAGFCFGNIMLMSFPEYLGLSHFEKNLQSAFRVLNLILAIPVFFYSAQPFYISAWKGLRHKYLNIDAPIALAIIVTFCRSVYEVSSGTGSGYFDSVTGIVFFMLVGRILQDKTYQQLSFERDYTSYFPVAVSVVKDGKEIPTQLPNIKMGDTLLIHNEELIPADGILTKGKALIDYSFVTGESVPLLKEMGEIVYAGGRQTGGSMELLVMKEVSQSYLTSLWVRDGVANTAEVPRHSFVQMLSRYFTYIVFSIAIITAAYWWVHDPSKIWNAVTAILIIACPCALLLSSTFTNGNILRILGRNHFYLRSADVIEDLANAKELVFDKTGTLTSSQEQLIEYSGKELSETQLEAFASLASHSNHPLNRMLLRHLGIKHFAHRSVGNFVEYPGKGIEGFVDGSLYAMGSHLFIRGEKNINNETTCVWVSIEGKTLGRFLFHNKYRDDIDSLIKDLKPGHKLSIISGDNAGEEKRLRTLTGMDTVIHFHQKPEDKLHYIEKLQASGQKVIMVGDGLNDAGALKKSNVGIAVAEDCNNFTPASDAILEAKQLPKLYKFIQICRANKKIVISSFVLSIVYNIIGLSFAVQGTLSPLVAAILMPSSSITILIITFGSSNIIAKWFRL